MRQLFTKNLIVIVSIALCVRILFAFSYDTADTGAFCNAGKLFLLKQEVYADPNVYFSGPPFALHVTAAMQWLGNHMHLSCQGMWKMPSVITDIGIGLLIYTIANKDLKKSKSTATKMAVFYLYNPIAIFISSFQGQQESFWLFFILLAWLLISRYSKVTLAAICVGIAFAYKIPVVLLIPGLLLLVPGWKKKILFLGIIGGIFVVSLFPEVITSRSALIRQSFLYSSSPGIWGFSGLSKKVLAPTPYTETGMKALSILSKVALGFGMILVYRSFFLQKKRSFFELSVQVFFVFLIFTPGFGPQYLQWLLPFFILTNNPFLPLYTLLVTFGYLHTYGLGIPPWDLVMGILQRNLYYKLAILYPYDLYYPVWMLLFVLFFKKVKKLPHTLRLFRLEF